jgi:hypothetical protein
MSKFDLEVNDALHFIAEGDYQQMPPKSVAYISRCINASEFAVRRAWELYKIVKDGMFYRSIGEKKFARL